MKILYIGNSIVHHEVREDLGWFGCWGMAASCKQKDFVHQLNSRLEAAREHVISLIRSLVIIEREPDSFSLDIIEKELEFKPDVIIIHLSENASDEKLAAFLLQLEKMIDEFNKVKPAPQVYVTGPFWNRDSSEEGLRTIAEKTGAHFISLVNVQGEAFEARGQFTHDGVAAHPSDKGMSAIADIIFKEIMP